uniref:Uncharacterized protein n=1 Tax=Spermophilus dauricus TaxID=99837 RepID=A0A8C9NWF9_SPEDA
MHPAFFKSDLIIPAIGLLSHHRKLQAQVETLFGLSCELLVGSVCVSLDYPFSALCLPSPP